VRATVPENHGASPGHTEPRPSQNVAPNPCIVNQSNRDYQIILEHRPLLKKRFCAGCAFLAFDQSLPLEAMRSSDTGGSRVRVYRACTLAGWTARLGASRGPYGRGKSVQRTPRQQR